MMIFLLISLPNDSLYGNCVYASLTIFCIVGLICIIHHENVSHNVALYMNIFLIKKVTIIIYIKDSLSIKVIYVKRALSKSPSNTS